MRSLATLLTLMTGCVVGDSYPDQYAREYCSSLYHCVDADETLTWTGWDGPDECRGETSQDLRQDPLFQYWADGSCQFDAEAASSCLDQLERVRRYTQCDGAMPINVFWGESHDNQCGAVYDCGW